MSILLLGGSGLHPAGPAFVIGPRKVSAAAGRDASLTALLCGNLLRLKSLLLEVATVGPVGVVSGMPIDPFL